MKELYKSPELEILCLRAAERLTNNDNAVEFDNVQDGQIGSFTYDNFVGSDGIDIPLK